MMSYRSLYSPVRVICSICGDGDKGLGLLKIGPTLSWTHIKALKTAILYGIQGDRLGGVDQLGREIR